MGETVIIVLAAIYALGIPAIFIAFTPEDIDEMDADLVMEDRIEEIRTGRKKYTPPEGARKLIAILGISIVAILWPIFVSIAAFLSLRDKPPT